MDETPKTKITMKWYTIVEIVDVTTGEVHNKNINMSEWIKIKKHTKYEINNEQSTGTRHIQYECRKRGKQLELEFNDF